MKVRELIKKLERYDGEFEVGSYDAEQTYLLGIVRVTKRRALTCDGDTEPSEFVSIDLE